MDNRIAPLQTIAYRMRRNALRATTAAGSGHPSSALSAADIVAALFFDSMHYDPSNPQANNNDRFILSKGHAAPILYAAWHEAGIIDEEALLSLRKFNSPIEGHPTPRAPFVDAATGSLGMGLSIGAGMALAAKKDSLDYQSYVLLGDSELTEGSIWEAAEIAAHYDLDNLIALVDVNRLGQRGATIEEHDLENYQAKFDAFGWNTMTIDGHDIPQILSALASARAHTDSPTVIIAKTIKGYGIPSIEDKNGYHGKAFSTDELAGVLDELAHKFPEASRDDATHEYTPPTPEATQGAYTTQPCTASLPNPTFDLTEPMATREGYGHGLVALGKVCPAVLSLDGEVSNSTYAEYFKKEFPDRFIECFIAEQNMVSMGVGIASRNFKPYISTFGAFMSRAFDQIRMAAISRSALRLVGSHAGVSIGSDGPSQMGLEDIALMRTLPNSIVLYPSDAVSAYKMVGLMNEYTDGISYLRTTRAKTPILYPANERFALGGSKTLRSSDDDQCVVIGAGITLHEALRAHDILQAEDIAVRVIDLYSIKPMDVTGIIVAAKQSGNRVITVEDHYQAGGIGEAVLTALNGSGILVTCLFVDKLPQSGTPKELLAYEGIDAAAIVSAVSTSIKQ